jgi:hypothetical protein
MPPSAAIESNPIRLTSSSSMRRWAGSSSTISMREAMLFNQLIFIRPISGAASNKSLLNLFALLSLFSLLSQRRVKALLMK